MLNQPRSVIFGFAMSLAAELQPDQNPELWNNHVTVYEEVFEPLTNAFATHALDRLNVAPGDRLIDIGAGAGGAATFCLSSSPQMWWLEPMPGVA